MQYVRLSKNYGYEKPCIVTGNTNHTGLKQEPKDIWTDKNIGTWKVPNREMITQQWTVDNESEESYKLSLLERE